MKNQNDQAMESYFSSMLNEEKSTENSGKTLVDDVHSQLDSLQKLPATLPETLVFSEQRQVIEDVIEVAAVSEDSSLSAAQATKTWKNIDPGNEFQVLFFEVAGLKFAVPLTDLGGIHHLDSSLNSLFGKPDWFSGVMTHNEALFNIVDTAKWINTGDSAESLNYTHYILLGCTTWGLSCEKLLGTETLTSTQIKWRKVPGKRPWLAGMVRDKMCALIHAEELVRLLDNGMNIYGH